MQGTEFMNARNVALVNLALCLIGYICIGVLFGFQFIDPASPLLGTTTTDRAEVLYIFYRKAFGVIRGGQFMVAVFVLLNLVMCIVACRCPGSPRHGGPSEAGTAQD